MGLRCKRCGGEEPIKDGFMRGKQRYRCEARGLNCTATPPRGMPLRVKVTAVLLHLGGLPMNRTAKLPGVSTPGGMTWIERFAEVYAQKPEPEGRAVVVELDEMWRYLKKSRTSAGSGRPGIVLRGAWLAGNAGVVTPPPWAGRSNGSSAGTRVSTARTTGRPTPSRSRRAGCSSAGRRRTASSATMPASGTGWPASAAAPAWCPGPRVRLVNASIAPFVRFGDSDGSGELLSMLA
jgi:transposase